MPNEKLATGALSVYDQRNRKTAAQSRLYSKGNDLVTKVYPTDVIPDQLPAR